MVSLICSSVAMLGSSVSVLVMHLMIQKRALEVPNRIAYISKRVRTHFDCMYIHHMCFVSQVRLGRSYEMDPRVM